MLAYCRLSHQIWLVQEMGVSLVSLISFFFTIYTVNKALQFRKSVVEAEDKVMDLIDEALQIMIPAGICKHICNPSLHLSVDRTDSKDQVRKQGHNAQQPEYPEDVSIALRNEDELYDLFGERKEEEAVKVEIRKAVNLAVKGIKKRSEIIVRMSPSVNFFLNDYE
ncbi:unnamed protein product [Angiostrongylus costaricensis]|uniref:Reticulon-like protein n=1 Tax=Angiostrongylus costaricensis TaxID=334426 RepID=A0A0R3PQ66_ANGCS|nr:unnamed protein product [Angiostrongylus costaricensis]